MVLRTLLAQAVCCHPCNSDHFEWAAGPALPDRCCHRERHVSYHTLHHTPFVPPELFKDENCYVWLAPPSGGASGVLLHCLHEGFYQLGCSNLQDM